MTLVKDTLISGFIPFFDQKSNGFTKFPENIPEMAKKWADVINDNYAQYVFPVSNTNEQAKAAFITVFLGISIERELAIQKAFRAYASIIATGMSMSNFLGLPPAIDIELKPVYNLGLSGATNWDCLVLMINIIDIYFKSGTATNNSTGATITWM
jgi:hypothetical protein